MSVFGEIHTTGKNFYTAGGSDGSDKSHLCMRTKLAFSLCFWKKYKHIQIPILTNTPNNFSTRLKIAIVTKQR